MKAVFVYKAFDDIVSQPSDKTLAKQIWFVDVHKFALCTFNWLVYNWEISSPLATNSLLELHKYYIP